MKSIKKQLQDRLDEDGDNYQLKTNEEIINIIIDFGFGETEFHTIDIERLLKENQRLKKLLNIEEI